MSGGLIKEEVQIARSYCQDTNLDFANEVKAVYKIFRTAQVAYRTKAGFGSAIVCERKKRTDT